MNIIKENWNQIIEKLKVEYEVTDICMKTWIHPLEVSHIEGNTVYISVEDKQSIEIISKKYQVILGVCIAELTGQEYNIIFVAKSDLTSSNNLKSNDSNAQLNELLSNANLKLNYSFDTFVVGKNNTLAHGIALAVAESPGEDYNPMFLYGGVGLGKTHLMHSIARYVIEQNMNKDDKTSMKKVLYVTSETFTNELIDALKTGKRGSESSMSLFREKYRTIDILLIDDIQFIIGKESTQEEFFHTFNDLYNAGKHIIISSDRPPKDMEILEERIRSRFASGMTVDISSPDYETRMAILYKKIELEDMERLNIPNEVISYIANNITTNIRELEGALTRVVAKAKLEKKEINIELAIDALKDSIYTNDNKKITPELIMDIVAEHFNVSVTDLCGRKRSADIALPRQIVMYLCREMTEEPFKSIGLLLGGKDHSTISHGYDKIKELMIEDDKVKNSVEIIIKKINPS